MIHGPEATNGLRVAGTTQLKYTSARCCIVWIKISDVNVYAVKLQSGNFNNRNEIQKNVLNIKEH